MGKAEMESDRKTLERRSFRLEVRATGDGGEVEGYGSVFNTSDDYGDIILPGSFTASLMRHKAAGTMPAMLWQHDSDKPIGVWNEMAEDANGLRIKGKLTLDVAQAREAHALLKAGALSGLSIGFYVDDGVYDRATDIRTITAIDLWEVSLVTFPANRLARVTNVKAAGFQEAKTIRDAERLFEKAGLSHELAVAGIATVKRIVNAERDARDADARAHLAAQKLLQSLKS